MARRSILDQVEEGATINLSSMIDAIFILLIFFIVTTVFVEEQGLTIEKPDASAPAAKEEDESLVLEIRADDTILFGGREIALGDVARRIRNGIATEQKPVMVRVHERSRHATFVAVWDAARRAGAEKLGFSTTN